MFQNAMIDLCNNDLLSPWAFSTVLIFELGIEGDAVTDGMNGSGMHYRGKWMYPRLCSVVLPS